MDAKVERTFIAIKPDGVQRGIVGDIIKRFEAKGFKLVGMKMMSVSRGRLFEPCHASADSPRVTSVTAVVSSRSTTKSHR